MRAPAIAAVPSGTRLIASTPQPIPTSIAPAAISPAIRCTACWADPHWASSVRQPVWIGSPACSQEVLVTLLDCSPGLGDAAAGDLLDHGRIDSGPLDQPALRGPEDLGRMQARQAAVPLADRGPDRFDDYCSAHAAMIERVPVFVPLRFTAGIAAWLNLARTCYW